MEENSCQFNNLPIAEKISQAESDYFYGKIDHSDLFFILNDINNLTDKLDKISIDGDDLKNVVASFLILERLKDNLIAESKISSIFDSQIQALYSNLEKLQQTKIHLEKSALNYDVSEDLYEERSTSQKYENSYLNLRIKNKRSNYPKKISRILKNWLKENMNNPYPSESEKLMLIELTGLDATQINNWFINARRRILPFMRNKFVKYD